VTDLARATGLAESVEGDGKRLNRVLQLTGFSDPVYAEAFVTVHQYDIVMDVTVLNRTRETLQVRLHVLRVVAYKMTPVGVFRAAVMVGHLQSQQHKRQPSFVVWCDVVMGVWAGGVCDGARIRHRDGRHSAQQDT
jgi:hypothetical protein